MVKLIKKDVLTVSSYMQVCDRTPVSYLEVSPGKTPPLLPHSYFPPRYMEDTLLPAMTLNVGFKS